MARTLEVVILGKDQLSGTLSKVQGSLSGIGTAALGIGGAITGAGAALGAIAMQAAPVEGIRAAFEGLAESSGESADVLLAALQEGSAGMVSQKDLMASYNMAAQLVSTTFANQLPNAMGYLSKVAAATGQDMDYMLNSLVVGVGRGSKMILDNLGITVDLDKAYQDWADSLGVAKDALSDEEKQAGLMAQVMTLLAENTAAMPDVTGTAAQSIGAMKAMLADTKDEIGLAFLPVLQELIPILRDLANTILPPLIAFIGRLAGWFGQLPAPVQLIVAAVGPLLTALGGLMLILAPLIPTISAVVGAILSIGTPIGWIVGIIAGLVGIVALLHKAWTENWGGIQDKMRAVWGLLRPVFDELMATLRWFWDEMKPRLLEAWAAITGWIQGTVIPAFRMLWDRMEPVREVIGKIMAALIKFMASAFITGLKVWLRGVISLWDAMTSAIGGVIDAIRTVLDWIGRALDAWRTFTSTTGGAGGGMGGAGAGIHQAGLAYVPTSPYYAMLHQGEAVLTKRQAADWRMGQGLNVHVYAGGVYGMDGAEELIDRMVREAARYLP